MSIFSHFRKKTDKTIPREAYLRYLSLFKTAFPGNMPVRELSFIVLDTETSGLDLQNDHLLSIGAVRVKNYQILIEERFEYLVRQTGYQPGESVGIHEILPRQSEQGLEEAAVIEKLVEFIGNDTVVGHHIGFDWAFLNKAAVRHLGGKLKNRTLDTSILARRVISPFFYQLNLKGDFSLDVLCRDYKVPMGQRHTAAGDALITAELFLKLLSKLERKGMNTRRALLQK